MSEGRAASGGTTRAADGSAATQAESAANDVTPPQTDAALPAPKGFPDTWRQDLAGDDRAFRKTLDRFDSPSALAKAYRELTTRLSSGEFKSTRPPPDSATPEQIATWRAELGLPDNAAAYVDRLQFDDSRNVGTAEKALLASFAEEAVRGHWTATQYNQAVRWYFDLQGRTAAQRDEADATFKHASVAELKHAWGRDYAVNRSTIAQFVDRSFPKDFAAALLGARLPDGRELANHPAFNKAVLELANTIDPLGTMLPNTSGRGLSGVESRIAEIEGKYMRAAHGSDSWKSYWTDEGGARMQQEYRGLLAAREQSRREKVG